MKVNKKVRVLTKFHEYVILCVKSIHKTGGYIGFRIKNAGGVKNIHTWKDVPDHPVITAMERSGEVGQWVWRRRVRPGTAAGRKKERNLSKEDEECVL